MRLILETGKTETDETEVARARATRLVDMIPVIMAALPAFFEFLFPKPAPAYVPPPRVEWPALTEAKALGRIHRRTCAAVDREGLANCLGVSPTCLGMDELWSAYFNETRLGGLV